MRWSEATVKLTLENLYSGVSMKHRKGMFGTLVISENGQFVVHVKTLKGEYGEPVYSGKTIEFDAADALLDGGWAVD